MNLVNSYPQHVKCLQANQRETLREEKAFLFIKAEGPVQLVTVDKGVIREKKKQKMCDFLIYDDSRRIARFIELKGTKVEDACDQIYDTVEYFEQDSVLTEVVTNIELLRGYIVSPHCNVPAINDTHRKKTYRKLYSKSLSKLSNAHDHLVFVRCISKNPGNKAPREIDGEMIVTNAFPLMI